MDSNLSGNSTSNLSVENNITLRSGFWYRLSGWNRSLIFLEPGLNLRDQVFTHSLDGADLSGSDLTGATFSNIDLRFANLKNCKLDGATFLNADLTGTDLSGSTITEATFNNADALNANLSESDLSFSRLPDSNFSGANLTNADLSSTFHADTNFTDAIFIGIISGGITSMNMNFDTKIYPSGWELKDGYLVETGDTVDNRNFSILDIGEEYSLTYIRDYEGTLHGGNEDKDTPYSYEYQGKLDANNDDSIEVIFTNKKSGRWVTGEIDSSTGKIDFTDYGSTGSSRVVGIYVDPLVTSGEVEQFGPHDSQVRFQNDLLNDNLTLKVSSDYDGDGFQEVYWKTNDGTAYLRALMHADGNIQYANYQNEEQMSEYLTSKGYESVISDIV